MNGKPAKPVINQLSTLGRPMKVKRETRKKDLNNLKSKLKKKRKRTDLYFFHDRNIKRN